MNHSKLFSLIGLSVLPFMTNPAFAWGPLGHRIVAETAALVMEKNDAELGGFMSRHRFELGYYAFLPDSQFRHHAGKRLEPPTHFFDIDRALLALKSKPQGSSEDLKMLQEIPENYKEYAKRSSAAGDSGSAPWRVVQFLKMVRQTLEPVKTLKGSYQSGQTDPEGAGRLFQSLIYLGLMSHYTGDATMPYHATSDFNGVETKQAGIHFYFEGACINALEPGLSTDVLAEAIKNEKTWLDGWQAKTRTPIQLLIRIFYESYLKVPEVAKLDRAFALLEPSTDKKSAVRKTAQEGCAAFRPILVEQLAKGAVLTAYLWSTELKQKLNFSEAALLQFSDMEASPKYPAPDYLN